MFYQNEKAPPVTWWKGEFFHGGVRYVESDAIKLSRESTTLNRTFKMLLWYVESLQYKS